MIGVGVNIWLPDVGGVNRKIGELVALGWEVWWPGIKTALSGSRVSDWLSTPNNYSFAPPGLPQRPRLLTWPVTGVRALYFAGASAEYLRCASAGALALMNSGAAGKTRWFGGAFNLPNAGAGTLDAFGGLGAPSYWRFTRSPGIDYGAFVNTAGNPSFPGAASIDNGQHLWLYSTPPSTGLWRGAASLATLPYPAPGDGSLAITRLSLFDTISYLSTPGYCGPIVISGTNMSAAIPRTNAILDSAGYI